MAQQMMVETRPGRVEANDPAELYLELLKRALTGLLLREEFWPLRSTKTHRRVLAAAIERVLPQDLTLVRRKSIDLDAVMAGTGPPPPHADTMVGLERLDNLHVLIKDVVERSVPGDLMECGVWRGGATVLMRGALEAYGEANRAVWAADSFAGLPKPDEERFPADAKSTLWMERDLAVSLDEVRATFARYGLLDDRVNFLPGWFRDTLPTAPVERLAVLRLDGDLYESTILALQSLYPKLSPGGYVIVDDYVPKHPACIRAVDDFLREQGEPVELKKAATLGVYWQRPS
ncbi:MAG TPA: TylF/MycF/NovP-related O-methyltransferase [Gaiellaceae bacterium]